MHEKICVQICLRVVTHHCKQRGLLQRTFSEGIVLKKPGGHLNAWLHSYILAHLSYQALPRHLVELCSSVTDRFFSLSKFRSLGSGNSILSASLKINHLKMLVTTGSNGVAKKSVFEVEINEIRSVDVSHDR